MKKETVFKIFSNLPTLSTKRLFLRAMHPLDADDMFAYARRDDVTQYLLWSSHTSLSDTRDYLRYAQNRYALGDLYDWAVIELESHRMIGTCGFASIDTANDCGEIGYVINPDFHGKGYAYEAAEEVLSFGFSKLGLHRIEARFMEGNDASLRVMKKLGMSFEGYHRDAIYVKGNFRTVGFCALTQDDFFKRISDE